MGGRREVCIISHRPVTSSHLKQERSFFMGVSHHHIARPTDPKPLYAATELSVNNVPYFTIFKRQRSVMMKYFPKQRLTYYLHP